MDNVSAIISITHSRDIISNVFSVKIIRKDDDNMFLSKRKSIRLNEFDYTQNGVYFITICTNSRKPYILSQICKGNPCGCPEIKLMQLGEIAEKTFKQIEIRYPVEIDYYVIMPNHIHVIIVINNERATLATAPTAIGNIVGAYKSLIVNKWLYICKQNN